MARATRLRRDEAEVLGARVNRRPTLLLALAAALALAQPLRAGDAVVVELFTSQGCAACPPADALLGRLAGREEVLPLSLHVDYWDYIGWADSFAQPAFTKRQKGYAHAAGERMVYTPQMIVGGRERIVGPRPMEVAEAIRRHDEAPSPVHIDVAREGTRLEVEIEPVGKVPGETLVQLVRYLPKASVHVKRGENAGRTLDYHNVVVGWETLARWDGRETLRLEHDIEGSNPAAVLVQAADYGPVLAAARAR